MTSTLASSTAPPVATSPTSQRPLRLVDGHRGAVLGPVTLDGETVTRGQRAIVAALILCGGDGATLDDLIDAVWPSGGPAAARASIQNQIARLRSSFGPDVVAHRCGRYRFCGTTDVGRFEALASRWVDRPPCPESIDDLGAAVALWRDMPYGVLADHDAASIERVRLEHLRAAAIETLAMSQMIADLFTDAVGVLRARTTADPFHDRAWELLLIALYLANRRTEALATYAEYARFLGEQFAVAPSSSMRDLRRIVADELSLSLTDLFAVATVHRTIV